MHPKPQFSRSMSIRNQITLKLSIFAVEGYTNNVVDNNASTISENLTVKESDKTQ